MTASLNRQMQAVRLAARGYRNERIANELGITTGSAAQLLHKARKNGLMPKGRRTFADATNFGEIEIKLAPDVHDLLIDEAVRRKTTTKSLVMEMLHNICKDNLFKAVIDE